MGNYIFPYEIIFVVTLKWLCENIYLQYCTFVWLASSIQMNSCCIPTCSFLEKHLLDKQGFKFYISFRILVYVLRFFFFSFFLHLSTKYSPCVVVYLGSTKNVCKFTTSWRNEYFSSRMFFCERCINFSYIFPFARQIPACPFQVFLHYSTFCLLSRHQSVEKMGEIEKYEYVGKKNFWYTLHIRLKFYLQSSKPYAIWFRNGFLWRQMQK